MFTLHWPWHSAVAQTLGWTVVHSLWQGTIVALAAAIVLRAMRGRSAAARYVVAGCAMVLMIGLAMATYWRLMPPAPVLNQTPAIVVASGEHSALKLWAGDAMPVADRMSLQAIDWLGWAWAAGVLVLGLNHLSGWVIVQRVRRGARLVDDARLLAMFNELSRRIGTGRMVRLARSSAVQVPTVIGWLWPMVLLPVGAFTGLTPDQLRGLLAHELAHVRRLDYAANLLQTLIETLLFYHPAVWWIGRRIRQEREHCCDDVAATLCDRASYAGALASMEELRQMSELALSARGGVLLPRIRRILLPGQKASAGARSWLMPAALLVIALVCLTALQPRARGDAAKAAASETQPSAGVYYISGVPRSGVYALGSPQDNLRYALSAAGFHGDPASKSVLLIRRDANGEETHRTLNLDDVLNASAPPLALRDNDVLLVQDKPSRMSGVYYMGGDGVERSGVYSLTGRGISLLQALVAAGVDPVAVRAGEVLVVRGGRDPQAQKFGFDMTRLIAERDTPFILEPNDIVMLHKNRADTAAHFVRLVLGQREITLEGQPVTLEKLSDALETLPDLSNTALEFAVESNQITKYQKYEAVDAVEAAVSRLGMKYITDLGVRPLGSKAGDH